MNYNIINDNLIKRDIIEIKNNKNINILTSTPSENSSRKILYNGNNLQLYGTNTNINSDFLYKFIYTPDLDIDFIYNTLLNEKDYITLYIKYILYNMEDNNISENYLKTNCYIHNKPLTDNIPSYDVKTWEFSFDDEIGMINNINNGKIRLNDSLFECNFIRNEMEAGAFIPSDEYKVDLTISYDVNTFA